MITLKKLEVYKKFNGDDDDWALAATKEDRKILTDAEWIEIGHLLVPVAQMKAGIVSPDYAERIKSSIKNLAADDTTAQAILKRA